MSEFCRLPLRSTWVERWLEHVASPPRARPLLGSSVRRCCLPAGSVLLGVGRASCGSLLGQAHSPSTGRPHRSMRVHPGRSFSPSELSGHPLNRPACRPDSHSMGSSHPATTTLELAPLMNGVSHPRSGSVLRLSQPLDGLLARSSFTALSHAAAVPGYLLQSLSLAEIARSSRSR
jgi:hypothetical protein